MCEFKKLLALLSHEELEKYKKLIPKGETPLWEYWEEFVSEKELKGKSAITTLNVRDALKFVIRRLNIYSIESCNNQRLFNNNLKKIKQERNHSSSTFNTYLKNVKTYFIWLARMEYIAENKLAKIEKCTEKIRPQLTLAHDHVLEVFDYIKRSETNRLARARNILFIDLLAFTGARRIELLNLTLDNIKIDGHNAELIIDGAKQKGRPRFYPLPQFIVDSYLNYMNVRSLFPKDTNALFVSSSKNGPWTEQGVRRLFRTLYGKLGFKITARAFRRYVATRLYLGGYNMDQIKDYLGHTRSTTTRRYIEDSCGLTKDCAKMMAEGLSL